MAGNSASLWYLVSKLLSNDPYLLVSTPLCTTLSQAWSVEQTLYGRKDGMSLLRLGYERLQLPS